MADVFISYARSTEESARKLADALKSAGYSIWFDDEIPGHRAYADVITEQLEAAKAVVVLWSKEASASQWVRSEANRAREKGTLVQARLDGTRLPMPFDQIQCVDLSAWRGETGARGWRKLCRTIAELTGSAGPFSPSIDREIEPPAGLNFGRRAIIAGAGATVVIAAAGGVAWYRSSEPDVPPRAVQLHQGARTIMQDGRPEEQDQAIAYLTEATQIAPGFARAWGLLAVAYALRKYQVPVAERAGNDARCRSAARTALDLDSDEPFAQCSLALLVPPYRNWAQVERMGRRLSQRHPHIPMTQHILADTFADVGRWKDGVEIYDQIDRTQFVIPLSERSIIQGLWSSGDLQRAEAMLERAAERWPKHRAIWNQRADFLMHTGRAGEAIRLLEDQSARPPGYPDIQLNAALATASALAGTLTSADAVAVNLAMLETAKPANLTYLNRKISTAQIVAQRAAALGDSETALGLFEGYYFGRGQWARVAPPAGNDDRNTATLFEPPMRGVWQDPGFGRLSAEIGLHDYWRSSGTVPDFRRA